MVGDSVVTPIEIRTWLEWAGGKLIAMPGARVGPADYKTNWPAYSQDTFQVLDFRAKPTLRVAPPAATEIAYVDEILALPALCHRQIVRRILHVRSLMHPLTARHLYTWAKIAVLVRKDARTVRSWHEGGILEVARKIPSEKVCRFRALDIPLP